ncbi:hypothetical protein J8273_0195 [Carpediemonas membranifera]|uniref:Transmembrane protein n=1 Tax=Carpediemonas membranifera TaxID=201153 RepID=A0A8J6E4V5_9EUKA|nr:hypothetical protein J8273_0195 [Carpediemonas membranifera]|eukprot:KAG9394987.1 hypothetical protein J8273_0195 [Carpediemonas membranifera]
MVRQQDMNAFDVGSSNAPPTFNPPQNMNAYICDDVDSSNAYLGISPLIMPIFPPSRAKPVLPRIYSQSVFDMPQYNQLWDFLRPFVSATRLMFMIFVLVVYIPLVFIIIGFVWILVDELIDTYYLPAFSLFIVAAGIILVYMIISRVLFQLVCLVLHHRLSQSVRNYEALNDLKARGIHLDVRFRASRIPFIETLPTTMNFARTQVAVSVEVEQVVMSHGGSATFLVGGNSMSLMGVESYVPHFVLPFLSPSQWLAALSALKTGVVKYSVLHVATNVAAFVVFFVICGGYLSLLLWPLWGDNFADISLFNYRVTYIASSILYVVLSIVTFGVSETISRALSIRLLNQTRSVCAQLNALHPTLCFAARTPIRKFKLRTYSRRVRQRRARMSTSICVDVSVREGALVRPDFVPSAPLLGDVDLLTAVDQPMPYQE